MKILSLNFQSLNILTKILALKQLVDVICPQILLLQESMMEGSSVEKLLSSVWSVLVWVALDSLGNFGAIVTEWKKVDLKLISVWSIENGLMTEVFPGIWKGISMF